MIVWEQVVRTYVGYWRDRSHVDFALLDAAGDLEGRGQPQGGADDELFTPQIVPRPDGSLYLTWKTRAFTYPGPVHRVVQRFGETGEPQGAAFELPHFAELSWHYIPARVAPRPDGGFVAMGQRREETSFELFAMRYDGEGRRLGKAIPVNQNPIFAQGPVGYVGSEFAMAADPSGGFVAVWRRPSLPDAGELLVLWQSGTALQGQLYSTPGVRAGSELTVDTADIPQVSPVVAATSTGWVVAWVASDPVAGEMEIQARIFPARDAAPASSRKVGT